MGEGVKIADLNGTLLFYSKDKLFGRECETLFESNGTPVCTLRKKLLSLVRGLSMVHSSLSLCTDRTRML